MNESDSDVWVRDYTTSTGVQVAGHWRHRHPGGGGGPDPEATPPDRAGLASSQRTCSGEAARHSVPAVEARVANAETRYEAASVAVGVSYLRHRHGDKAELREALDEQQRAREALKAARDESAAQGPVVTAPSSAGGAVADRCPGCGQFRSGTHRCPTPAGLPAGDYAGLKRDERVKMMVGDLEASVQAIVESGQLHRWLDAMSSNGLSRWSANNRILAAVQMLQRGESLEDLHMMGFRQWEKYNRTVSKGAKAVWILAPVTRKVVGEDADGDPVEHRRVVGFKGVPVFNVTDTQGDPLPESPVRPSAGAATPGTVQGLRDRVSAAGYTCQETEIPGCRPATGEGTLGYTDPKTKQIVVDSRLGEAQKASVLAHELGHVHCGHVDGDYGEYLHHRGQMETEAEMTAYLVNRSRGMTRDQVDAFSPGYIASWSKGDPGVTHRAVDKATRAFNKIIDGPWPTPNGD